MQQSINLCEILQLQDGKEKKISEMKADLKIAEYRLKGLSLAQTDQSNAMEE